MQQLISSLKQASRPDWTRSRPRPKEPPTSWPTSIILVPPTGLPRRSTDASSTYGEIALGFRNLAGYNKRVHSLTATMTWVCAALRRSSRVHDDTVWLVDSTPIECARSRPTVMRPALAG